MAFTPIDYIASYFGWTHFTPALPSFYWDVYSAEERIKKMCMELHKLCEYANMLADNINIDHTLIQELQDALANIENLDEINEQVLALQDAANTIQETLDALPSYEEFTQIENKLDIKPYVFDTVADMKNYEYLSSGDSCITKGFYEVNDYGGARYTIVSSGTVDDMEYIALNNGLIAHIDKMEIATPEMFGAKHDGVNDDTNAIQKAMDTEGNIVFHNDYYCLSYIYIKGNIEGNGHTILTRSTLWTTNNVSLSNLTIDSFVGTTRSHGITAYDSANVTLKNIHIVNARNDGIAIFNTDIKIDGLIIDMAYRNGISLVKGSMYLNDFVITEVEGAAPQIGIDIEPNNLDQKVTRCVIKNGTIMNSFNLSISTGPYLANCRVIIENVTCRQVSFRLDHENSFFTRNLILLCRASDTGNGGLLLYGESSKWVFSDIEATFRKRDPVLAEVAYARLFAISATYAIRLACWFDPDIGEEERTIDLRKWGDTTVQTTIYLNTNTPISRIYNPQNVTILGDS